MSEDDITSLSAICKVSRQRAHQLLLEAEQGSLLQRAVALHLQQQQKAEQQKCSYPARKTQHNNNNTGNIVLDDKGSSFVRYDSDDIVHEDEHDVGSAARSINSNGVKDTSHSTHSMEENPKKIRTAHFASSPPQNQFNLHSDSDSPPPKHQPAHFFMGDQTEHGSRRPSRPLEIDGAVSEKHEEGTSEISEPAPRTDTVNKSDSTDNDDADKPIHDAPDEGDRADQQAGKHSSHDIAKEDINEPSDNASTSSNNSNGSIQLEGSDSETGSTSAQEEEDGDDKLKHSTETRDTLPTSDRGHNDDSDDNSSCDIIEKSSSNASSSSLPFKKRKKKKESRDLQNSDHSIAFEDSSSSEDGDTIAFHDSSHYTLVHAAGKKKKPMVALSPSFQSKIVKYFNATRIICGKVVNQKYVQQMIVCLIILNALQMGLATFDFVYYDPVVRSAFDKLDLAFLIVFTIEICMQFIFHGWHLLQDGWLTFDMLIVIFSWAFASVQIFRTLRTLRLVARVEMLRKLCQALMEAVPRLAGILFLFLLVMYIYAVMITVLFGDMYANGQLDDNYFSRLDITLFTLFQMITLDWAKIARQVMDVYPHSFFVFVTYLSFTSFILFSLIIGVVCDAVSAIEHDAQLLRTLEKKEDAQERILRLQQRVDYLKKQQKSVLASVSGVVESLKSAADENVEPFAPRRCLTASSFRNSGTIQEEKREED